MIYYSDEARNCAMEHVSNICVKLATTKPNDDYLTLDDIREALHYFRVLKDALEDEQRGVDRKRHDAERKARMEKAKAGA